MSNNKILWSTVKVIVPSEFITVTDKGMIRIKPPLTKTNKIATSKKKPAIDIQTGDVDEVKIIDGGDRRNPTEFKEKRKQTKSMFNELKDKAETMHEKMARLRAMRKNVTVRKKSKPVLKDIPENYDELMELGKQNRYIPLKKDGKYSKKDLEY